MFSLKLAVRVSKRVNTHTLLKRYTSSEKVRVRFAPSPTGHLHIGGLRTALFNHLFAKTQNGVTILRIEDTDLTRKVNNATEDLIEDLEWCGITYDEGPYFQSKRLDLYQKYAKQLIEQGDAYYCFCENFRLNLIRQEAVKSGEIPKYDNCCRHLTKEQVDANFKNGKVPCVRFKLSSLDEGFDDLINGKFHVDIAATEGDPVILKADGFPTYHFANVVDDHLMGITHVLRGCEWQISTPKHILMYKAFKWDPPRYAHLPLMMNVDGSKISKRQGDARIRDLRQSGFLPNAVLNFVIRFGGGFDINQKEKDLKNFTFDELVEKFDISKIKPTSSRVSLECLNDYNNLEIRRLLKTEEGTDLLVKMVQDIVRNHYQNSNIATTALQLDHNHIKLILQMMSARLTKLKDLVSDDFCFLWSWNNIYKLENEVYIEAFDKLVIELEKVEWNLENLKEFLKAFSKNNDLKFPVFMKTLRMILAELKDGPSVGEIMQLLGKERTVCRLTNAINRTKESSAGRV